jgi:LAS superfamily LD-carboxypeptidase LdcB
MKIIKKANFNKRYVFIAVAAVILIIAVVMAAFYDFNSIFNSSPLKNKSLSSEFNKYLKPAEQSDNTSVSDYTQIYSYIDDRKAKALQTYEDSVKGVGVGMGASSGNSDNQDSQNSDTGDKPYYAYPDNILPCTRSGNDLLVLVNKKYKLPSSYAPGDLTPVSNSGIRTTKSGLYVRNIMIEDLKALNTAVKSEGIDIAVLSAYRSYSTQQSTYNYWVNYNGGNTDAADQVSARAGHSQHQLGTAVDFTSSEIGDALGTQFEKTSASRWLTQNAWKYGFALSFPKGWESETGFNYEPWHYRYIGRENTASWHSSGQILEVWLRGRN